MAQFVDGKDLGLDEEDIRQQMAATSGMTLYDFTQVLYDQAVEEQRRAQRASPSSWRNGANNWQLARCHRLHQLPQEVGAW